MATANYKQMDIFPLYVTTDLDEYDIMELQDYLVYTNRYELDFFNMYLLDGYYEGVQIYVEPKNYADEVVEDFILNREFFEYDIKLFDFDTDEELREAISQEVEKIKEIMKEIKDNYGFEELEVYARFDSGEVWYNRKN